MTALTALTAQTSRIPALDRGRPLGLTPARLVRSELIKLRTLRSTTWAALTLGAVAVALTALVAVTAQTEGNSDVPGLATTMTLTAVSLVLQPVTVIMGVIFATTDYASGAIRSTLAAAPGRWAVLGAKTAAAAAVLFVSGLVTVGLSFALMFWVFRARGFAVTFGAGDFRTLIGLVLYGVILGLVGFFIGFVTRSAVAGIGIGLGLTLIVPILVTLGSSVTLVRAIGGLLPEHLAHQMWAVEDPNLGGFPGGLALSVAWLVILFCTTGALFQERDA